jgi:uncharacterized protein
MAIHLLDADTADLGRPRAKATTLDPGQTEALRPVWSSPDDTTETGIWEATPGRFTATREGYHEICQILAGRVTVIPDGAEPVELSAGDTLVTPEGWRGVWHVHETTRKQFVIVRTGAPAAAEG